MSYFKWKQYDEAAECYSKIWPILDLSRINILGAENVLDTVCALGLESKMGK
jgi:hypothetical protein